MGVSVGSSIYNAASIYESGAAGGGGGGSLPIDEIISIPSGYTLLDKLEFKGYKDERIVIPFNGFRSDKNKTDNILELNAKLKVLDATSFFGYLPNNPRNGITFSGSSCYFFSNNGFIFCFNGLNHLLLNNFCMQYTYNKAWLNGILDDRDMFSTINTINGVLIGDAQGSDRINLDHREIFSFVMYDSNWNKFFMGVPAFDEANEVDGLIDLITNEFFPHEWTT